MGLDPSRTNKAGNYERYVLTFRFLRWGIEQRWAVISSVGPAIHRPWARGFEGAAGSSASWFIITRERDRHDKRFWKQNQQMFLQLPAEDSVWGAAPPRCCGERTNGGQRLLSVGNDWNRWGHSFHLRATAASASDRRAEGITNSTGSVEGIRTVCLETRLHNVI